ncbi:hypothetical protein RIR_jg39580.t1 [Rhizophagus irregularis DAOM 181602=DAOM 197198]|uniref:Uncharacterized protein n=1 Tax=Rhizophagus irregularis (strain DAOM 181602 / DAOM 197198 / MUCL 43194) TaxID=747089 RepID=U9TQ34_RHIID|nr:hypothetical protein RIR_jg39580.t1 [Rhizophagus irregularis DAOM 181602=DAOM 197198]
MERTFTREIHLSQNPTSTEQREANCIHLRRQKLNRCNISINFIGPYVLEKFRARLKSYNKSKEYLKT